MSDESCKAVGFYRFLPTHKRSWVCQGQYPLNSDGLPAGAQNTALWLSAFTVAHRLLRISFHCGLSFKLSKIVPSLRLSGYQREKKGWMGDAQWTAEEAMLNFDMVRERSSTFTGHCFSLCLLRPFTA